MSLQPRKNKSEFSSIMDSSFRQVIREQRIFAHKSQAEFGASLSPVMSQSYVSTIESGARDVSVIDVLTFMQVLDYNLDAYEGMLDACKNDYEKIYMLLLYTSARQSRADRLLIK